MVVNAKSKTRKAVFLYSQPITVGKIQVAFTASTVGVMVVPCCNPIEVKFQVGQVGENILTLYAQNAKFDEDRPTVDYTRCPYIFETPPYILNVLEYKYYTSIKPITIFL